VSTIESGERMPTIPFKRTLVCLVLILAFAGAAFLVFRESPSWAQERKFQKKECLDCHKKFSEKYLSMKNLHPGMKEGKCEDCHLRHGIVPKKLMKRDGNDLCISCHNKEKLGLNQPKVHTVLKTGKCASCHNPHGSQGSHLLKAEGPEACYQCHKKEAYQQKVVHAVLQKDGCRACHRPHSSAEPDLLVKAKKPLCLSCHEPGKGNF
jgi:predicted CXXCH cytochrome family protein